MKKLGEFYPQLVAILDSELSQESYYKDFLMWLEMHCGIRAFAAKYFIRPTFFGDTVHSLALFIDDTDGPESASLERLSKKEISGIRTAFHSIVKITGSKPLKSFQTLDLRVISLSEALIASAQSKMDADLRDMMIARLKRYGVYQLTEQDGLYVIQTTVSNEFHLSPDECKTHIRRIISDHLSKCTPKRRAIDPRSLQVSFIETDLL